MADRTIGDAVACLQNGRMSEAARICKSLLKADGHNAEALFVLALTEMDQRKFREAVRLLEKAVEINPGFAPVWANLGNARIGLKDFDGAVAAYNHALTIDPLFIDAHFNRAKLLKELGRLDEALAGYDACVAIAPQFIDALVNRGNTLALLGRHAEALDCYDKCLQRQPNLVDVLYNRGNVLARIGRSDEALVSYDRCLALAPTFAEAFNSRGKLCFNLGHYDKAADNFRQALHLDPAASYARGSLLHARQQCCDWTHLDEDIADLTRRVRKDEAAAMPFVMLGLSSSLDDQLSCARAIAAHRLPLTALPARQHPTHERIRIAYVCSDFREHATSKLAVGLFERHDRAGFETVGVSIRRHPDDAMRERVKAAFATFIDVEDKSDRAIAAALREMEIDIAVDLNGFSQDGRPDIFALRPAPVQVSFLAFPGTMGASYIDYLIADKHVVHSDEQGKFSEKIVTLPNSYQVNDYKHPVGTPAPRRADIGLPEQGVVFCCFNQSYKITPAIFDIWMRLLRDVEGSVLWLLETSATAAGHLRQEAGRRGVAGDRLVFAPRTSHDNHLARQALADLFLDTLPYNAHTTASDALWMGVPVVTCEGATFAGRVATSLLHAVGLPDLVTSSLADYEALALRLAREPDLLAQAKATLAANRAACPLFDTDRYRQNLEAAFTTMHRRRLAGQPPASFAVDDQASPRG